MTSMSNPLSPENLPGLISELKNQGWVRRTGVLDQNQIQNINSYMDSHRTSFRLSPVVSNGVLAPDDHIRGDMFIIEKLESPAPEMAEVVQMVNDFAEKLREGGFKIEDCQLHPTYFPPLHFFRKHVDIYSDVGVIVTFLFYVNKDWDARDGGNLILYDHENNVLGDFLPEPGSFVALLSRKIPHEVRVCKKERRSIAGWFHDRPYTPASSG